METAALVSLDLVDALERKLSKSQFIAANLAFFVVLQNVSKVVTMLGACAGGVASQALGSPQSDFRDSIQDRNKMMRPTMAKATHREIIKTRGKACLCNTDDSIIVISKININRKSQCPKQHPNVASTMTT